MKVLYLAPPATKQGRLATFIEEEVIALAKAGVEIILIGLTPSPLGPKTIGISGIHVRVLPPGKALHEIARTLAFLWRHRASIPPPLWMNPMLLLQAMRLERFARELACNERVDIVHSNFGWPGGFGGSLATRDLPTRLVTTLRGMDVLVDPDVGYGLRRSRAYDRAQRRLLRSADCTIHVSDFVREQAIRLGAPESRARTVHKGVDCERFCRPDPAGRTSDGIATILTVGLLIKRKGVDHILQALSMLADSHEFSFVIVGEGRERAALGALVAREGLGERVHFAGRVSREDIPQSFAGCDIFILASTLEASGNVLLEAMASGCPVICTASGGPPEYVDDGITGFVVPVGDPQAMAEKTAMLLDDAGLRFELGQNGRRRALELFSYSRMVEDTIAIYKAVLKS